MLSGAPTQYMCGSGCFPEPNASVRAPSVRYNASDISPCPKTLYLLLLADVFDWQNFPFRSDPAFCAFSYSAALTPNISSVTPNAGTIGDTITISGQGFAPSPANNTVLVGGVRAQTLSSSGGQIQAKLAPGGTAGWTRVVVVVDGKGYAAESAADVTAFRLRNLQLASFWPPTVSVQGGTLVTLSGSGFDPLNVTRNSVTVCGATCPVVNITTTSQTLTCVAPAAAQGPCSVSVSVDLGSGQSDSVSLSGMTYAAAGVPILESFTPLRVSTGSGGLILIQGQDLAASTVKLRDLSSGGVADCDVISANGTQLTCQADVAAAGAYRVLVASAGNVTAISAGTVQAALGKGLLRRRPCLLNHARGEFLNQYESGKTLRKYFGDPARETELRLVGREEDIPAKLSKTYAQL